MKSIFDGTGVAIVTPFKDGQVDFLSLGRLIDIDLEQGAKAIVALGTTGEGSTISQEERREVIKFCKDKIAGRAKLVVGTGNNNFQTCYENTKMAKKFGVDGVLVVTPYYNKTTQLGLVRYYQELSKLEIPMLIYNVPSRTGLMLELPTLSVILKSNDWVYGIKESTADASRITKLCKLCKDKVAVYSGEDNLNYLFYSLGASGAISVTANVYAGEVQKVYALCKENRFADALSVQQSLAPIDEALFFETNPIPVKYMLSQKGLCSDEVRLPLVPMSAENKTKLNNAVSLYEASTKEQSLVTSIKRQK